jgi:tight adherence protein B
MCSALAFILILILLQHLHRESLYVKTRIKQLFSVQANNEGRQKRSKKNKKNSNIQISLKGKIIKLLTTELSLAGIRLRAEEFITIWALSAFLPTGITLLLGVDWTVALGLLILGIALPYVFVRGAKAKRLALFEQQLSDALVIMGNCLRTGLSFQQAINSIARDMPEPISKEFSRVSKEVQLGVTLDKALENMVERLGSKDFMLIVAAVLIQRQVGGNLSEILDGISDTIRERIKIKASLKVLTATGRTSGFIIGLLPVFLMLVLMLINPPYIRSFFESTLGIALLCIAGGLEVIGFLIVKKVVNIKF